MAALVMRDTMIENLVDNIRRENTYPAEILVKAADNLQMIALFSGRKDKNVQLKNMRVAKLYDVIEKPIFSKTHSGNYLLEGRKIANITEAILYTYEGILGTLMPDDILKKVFDAKREEFKRYTTIGIKPCVYEAVIKNDGPLYTVTFDVK